MCVAGRVHTQALQACVRSSRRSLQHMHMYAGPRLARFQVLKVIATAALPLLCSVVFQWVEMHGEGMGGANRWECAAHAPSAGAVPQFINCRATACLSPSSSSCSHCTVPPLHHALDQRAAAGVQPQCCRCTGAAHHHLGQHLHWPHCCCCRTCCCTRYFGPSCSIQVGMRVEYVLAH